MKTKIVNRESNISLVSLSDSVYRQLGDSKSQWHKKKFKKVPVWGSASLGKCQLGEVPVGEVPVWRLVPVGGLVPIGGQNLTFGQTIFFQFRRR